MGLWFNSTRMPQELLDIVIDHLHDHKPSLLACSLVNHSWLKPSRTHLFRVFEVRPTVDFSEDEDGDQRVASFLSLINTALYISRCIRELHICARPLKDMSFSIDTIAQILDHLNVLSRLDLVNCVLTPGTDAQPRSKYALDRLVVRGCSLAPDKQSLLDLFDLFTKISLLRVESLYGLESTPVMDSKATPTLQVDSLVLYSTIHIALTAEYLRQKGAASTLTSLSFSPPDVECFNYISTILSASASTLTSFTYGLYYKVADRAIRAHPDMWRKAKSLPMSKLTSLKSFHLNIFLSQSHWDANTEVWSTVFHLLESIIFGGPLEDVTIDIFTFAPPPSITMALPIFGLHVLDWARLKYIFSRFNDLKSVTFVTGSPLVNGQFEMELKELKEKGILKTR